MGPQTSVTRSLEDERRTKEVLRDLGLHKNGPWKDAFGLKSFGLEGEREQDYTWPNDGYGEEESSNDPSAPPSFGLEKGVVTNSKESLIVPNTSSREHYDENPTDVEASEDDDLVEAITT